MNNRTTTENDVTYSSAVDLWLMALVFAPLIYLLYAFATGDPSVRGTDIAIVLVIYASVCALLFPMRYTLTGTHLLIQVGVIGFFYKQKIELAKITDVTLSYNPLSAPALSVKRVKIEFEGGFMGFNLISPKDRKGFIEELNRRREVIRVAGDS